MKRITISEANIKDIYTRIRRFFYNNNRTGFTSWHNFDCGFKKRINKYININGEKVDTSQNYPMPLEVTLDKNKIYITMTAGSGTRLSIGDEIAFLSNRIILKQKWDFSLNKTEEYIYTVFQAKPMHETTQKMLHQKAEEEEAAYMKAYYEDYNEEYEYSDEEGECSDEEDVEA